MSRKQLATLVLFGVLAGSSVQAAEVDQENQKELLEQIQKLEKQIAELTALQQRQQTVPAKQDQCMKVVGVESYCTCVVEKLPASIDYRRFVNILLTPAQELDYEHMPEAQKKDIDRTLVAWAKCVTYKGPQGAGFLDGLMNRDTLF